MLYGVGADGTDDGGRHPADNPMAGLSWQNPGLDVVYAATAGFRQAVEVEQ
jgi:hypothetical protein